ncbi:MAG TPA: hypothetical protein VFP10_02865, partial [Candidatus Eisenbacteria bacterium]|nr:hypothetical protein [Candidatus Eisenbacteria bacterium]
DLVARILEREPDWNAVPAGTPPRVVALIRRCLRKDARERLRDMGDARLELREALEPHAAAAATTAHSERPVTGLGRRTLPIAAAVLVTFLATWGLMRFRSHPTEAAPLRVSVLGPEGTTLSEEVPDLVISPDGRTLAFVAMDSTGQNHVWIRSLSSPSCRRLSGTKGGILPFWSPDGRNLGFFANEKLMRIPITGETPQVVAGAPNPRGAAWGPNNIIVFAPAASGPLMQVLASGGEPKPATTLDASQGESAHRFPTFLPDGEHFLYVALPGKDNRLNTRVGTLDAKPGPVLVTGMGAAVFAEPGFLMFNRDGVIVGQRFDPRSMRTSGNPLPIRDLVDVTGSYSGSPAVSASTGGVLVQRELASIDERIDVLDRTGKALGNLPGLPAGSFLDLRVSPDQSHIVFQHWKRGQSNGNLIMANPARGMASRFTFEAQLDLSPAWTPDSRRVIYGSDRTGGRNIYWKNADGSGGEILLADVPNLFNDPLQVSPDGRTLLYRSLSGETGEDLWTLTLVGDPNPTPLLHTRFNEMHGALSPDGHWIVYQSDESGRFELYTQSFPALDRRARISVDGTLNSMSSRIAFVNWRDDGRE